MEKFLLSLLCLLTVSFAGQAEEKTIEIDCINSNSGITFPSSGYGETIYSDATSGFTIKGRAQKNNGIALQKSGGYICVTENSNLYKITRIEVSAKTSSSSTTTLSCKASDNPYAYTESNKTDWDGENIGNNNCTKTESTFKYSINKPFAVLYNSTSGGMISISNIKIIYDEVEEPTFPTKCAEPVFTINGVKAEGKNMTACAGSKIAVSCATKDSKTVWSVAKGNDENGTTIESAEYVIPADAEIGDTYTFAATSSVQGEEGPLFSSNYMTVTIEKKKQFVYTQVKSTDELVAGAKYVIGYYNQSGSKSMDIKENGDYIAASDVTITDGIMEASPNTLIFTLQGTEDNWVFYGDNYLGSNKYLTFAQSTKTNIKMSANGTKSKISFTSQGNVNIQNNTSGETRFIKYNGSSDFRYYTSSNGVACQLYRQVVKPEVEPVAPAVPELASGDFSLTENELKTEEKTLRINFAKVEGLDIYYSLKADATAVTLDEGEGGKVTRAEGESHTHDAAFQLHDGNEIELNNTHTQLSYFACDPATGMHSETKTLALTIGATGVAEIEAAEAGEVRWFDMQGREVKGQPAAGVYVRVANGKAAKVIVK